MVNGLNLMYACIYAYEKNTDMIVHDRLQDCRVEPVVDLTAKDSRRDIKPAPDLPLCKTVRELRGIMR